MTRLVHVTTVPETLGFFVGQVQYMAAQGFDVHALSSPGPVLDAFGQAQGIAVHGVELPRQISPLHDLGALRRVASTFRALRPQVVHAHTPKGGLLGMMGATLARVPLRIYHIHGLPFTTATGVRRQLLRTTERTACALAHQVLCVSEGVRRVAVEEGLCPAEKIRVLHHGSINGVDAMGRFDPARGAPAREALRARLGIPGDALVIGFVGRMVRDKGVVELQRAWATLREQFPAAHLVMVGPREARDAVPAATLDALRGDARVHLTGPADAAAMYPAMDVVALPTYREGFPVVPLEVAAMALPIVATRIPGCVDAVEDGRTGTLVPAGDAGALAGALARYLADPELRARHGAQARARVLADYRQEEVWAATYREYLRLLAARGLAAPEGAS